MPYLYIITDKLKELGWKGKGYYNLGKGKKSTGLWIRTTPKGISFVALGNRIKNSDGSYVLLNSDGTASVLRDKQGNFKLNNLTLADKLNMNAGNVFDSSRQWGLDTNSTAQTYTDEKTGRTYFKNKQGQWISFKSGLGLKEDQQAAYKKLQAKLTPKNKTLSENISDNGVISALINSGADALGIGKDSWLRTGADLLGSFAYAVPVLGTAASLYDAYNATSKGNYGNAAATLALGLLPGGRLLKGIKSAGPKGMMQLYKTFIPKTTNPYKLVKGIREVNNFVKRPSGKLFGIADNIIGGYLNPFGLSKGWNRGINTYVTGRAATIGGGLAMDSNFKDAQEEKRQADITNKFVNDNLNQNTIRNFDLNNFNKYVSPDEQVSNNNDLINFRNNYYYRPDLLF